MISSPSNVLVKIDMNTTAAPFDDVNVRKAFAYALPYEQIINNVYGGDARRANSPIPLDMPGNSATGYPYDTDIDAAKAALAAAGVDAVEAELIYGAGDVEQEQLADPRRLGGRRRRVHADADAARPGDAGRAAGGQDDPAADHLGPVLGRRRRVRAVDEPHRRRAS